MSEMASPTAHATAHMASTRRHRRRYGRRILPSGSSASAGGTTISLSRGIARLTTITNVLSRVKIDQALDHPPDRELPLPHPAFGPLAHEDDPVCGPMSTHAVASSVRRLTRALRATIHA